MSIRLTILCENSVDRVSPYGLLGEHGFTWRRRMETFFSTPAAA